MERFDHFIAGESVTPSSGRYLETVDPCTARPWALVARGDAVDADRAVRAAHTAMTDGVWARATPAARAGVLRAIAAVLRERWEELVAHEVRDNGKRIAEVRGQFSGLHRWYDHFADRVMEDRDTGFDNDVPGVTTAARYEPFGVVVAITPWNSPLMIGAWKLAPALAAGNAVVLKPSEHASASTVAFARLIHEADIPAGIVNVVTGLGAEVGAALVSHPLTAKVSFTGSDIGGAAVGIAAAREIKPAVLELGGKSAQVVFADADVENAVNGILSGIFLSNGQSCVAGSRLIVERSAKDALLARLIARAARLRPGNPMEPATLLAPLANEPQFRKTLSMIEAARAEGATCMLGGGRPDDPAIGEGYFVAPTIFDGVTPQMALWREEVFGPVLSVTAFDTEAEALALVNDSRYGLAAGVWTSDASRGERMANGIEAGTVYINHYRSVAAGVPIGGYKRSGYGRELGPHAILDFQQVKAVWTGTAPVPDPFPNLS